MKRRDSCTSRLPAPPRRVRGFVATLSNAVIPGVEHLEENYGTGSAATAVSLSSVGSAMTSLLAGGGRGGRGGGRGDGGRGGRSEEVHQAPRPRLRHRRRSSPKRKSGTSTAWKRSVRITQTGDATGHRPGSCRI